uniref:Uncharacterized protein n=1 Tax=Glossina pallidipes TaxID=7398 RepID=A0A1A9ZJ10_GLOPL
MPSTSKSSFRSLWKHLPGISLPPQKQSGNRQTSLRHFAAVLSGVGMGLKAFFFCAINPKQCSRLSQYPSIAALRIFKKFAGCLKPIRELQTIEPNHMKCNSGAHDICTVTIENMDRLICQAKFVEI